MVWNVSSRTSNTPIACALSGEKYTFVPTAAAEAASYSGQVAYGQKVYCVPRTGAGGVGVFDVTFETLTNVPFAVDFATENATDLFSGGAVVGTVVD